MDFSRLHTYTPPQCVPENTGYTYALSSSYSSDALDFEIEHKIDPVFDSPRMSRRSLRLAAAGLSKPESARNDVLHDSPYSGSVAFREQLVKQRKSINKQSGSVRDVPRRNLSSSPIFNQSSFLSRASDTSMVSTVLDESSIREQTEVDHFWGLDDDGDPKGGDATLLQRNGDIATAETQTTMINGYTCSDCSMLSERKEVLTAYSASSVPSSRIYSRDRSQKHASSNELEKQMAFVSDRCHHHDEEYSKVLLLLHNLQDQVAQMGDRNEILKLIRNVMDQHLKDKRLEEKTDFLALHQEHNLRLIALEDLLRKLSAESKDIQKELEIAKAKTVRDGDEHNQLLSRVKKLELELSQVKSELLTVILIISIVIVGEQVDAQVKESVKMMLFGDQHKDFPESLLQWLTSNFVTRSDLQTLLQDLELQILKNITGQMAVTNQRITSEVVTSAVNNAGISGITEAQAQIIVNNALKLYSQDKTGMVDFKQIFVSLLQGLDDEYQEEGTFLGQYVYDQEGEPLQMFTVEKSENAFQIVELRILSNWGHAEYTCLYRFRVHGKPAE
uniref:SUN domain-containing protein n=1 Tax=Pavo cristatus TaxID=9049 RepID=A0A8C9EU57_PAVCR